MVDFLGYVSMYFAAREEGYSRRESCRVSLYATPLLDQKEVKA